MKAYITVTFKHDINRDTLDLGSFEIRHSSGRSYMLDVDQSWADEDDNIVHIRASEDFETFPDEAYRYDLTLDDITSRELNAWLYIGTDDDYDDHDELVSIDYCIVDDRGDIIADNLIANPES
jgi:hypothetical protein